MKKTILSGGESLQAALDRAEKGDIIVLEPRVYREKIKIVTPDVTIEGSSGSRLVWSDAANFIHSDGREFNTFRTATVTVAAKGVTMKNLDVCNDAGDPQKNGQAVALAVLGGDFLGINIKLSSLQDTLFLGPLPDDLATRYTGFLPDDERLIEGELTSLFLDSEISGSVDFIFGAGAAYFDGCRILVAADGRKKAYVAAPAHSLKQVRGFTFFGCEFLAEEGINAQIYLARPWRDYGKCVFIDSVVKAPLSPAAFDRWGDSARDRTARFLYYPAPVPSPAPWSRLMKKSEVRRAAAELTRLKKRLLGKGQKD